MENYATILVIVLAAVSALRPWITLVLILALGLIGALVPDMQDIRGLSIIAIGGTCGMLRYVVKSELRGWSLLWPLSFFGLFVLNTTLSSNPSLSFVYLLAGSFCAYYLAVYTIRSREQALILAYAAIIVGLVASVISLFDYDQATKVFSEFDPIYAGRIHGAERTLIGNPNYFFPQIIAGLFFAVTFCFTSASKTVRMLMFSAIGVMISGIFVTLSRGSVISMAAIFASLIIPNIKWRSFDWLRYLLPAVGVMIVFYFVFPNVFSLLYGRLMEGENSYAFGSRSQLAILGFKDFVSSPVWGVGLGSMISTLGVSPHDGYLAVLGEMGLLGFIVFYSYPCVLCIRIVKARRRARVTLTTGLPVPVCDVLLAFMIGMLVYNVFNNVIYSKTVLMLFGVVHLFLMASQGKQTVETQAFTGLIGTDRRSSGRRSPRRAGFFSYGARVPHALEDMDR